ncbi:MAG: hypothetical protein KGV44_03210 [Flavobacteriaceae bacterium]|nr:hypothetical protein [Flavobacteriaceae bacterium]
MENNISNEELKRYLQNISDDWEEKKKETQYKEDRKKYFTELGKKGGRPRKEKEKKIHKILCSFDESELEHLNRLAQNCTKQEVIRRLVLGKEIRNAKENQQLAQIIILLQRNKNWFGKDFWNEKEKVFYKNNLSQVINLTKQILKNL